MKYVVRKSPLVWALALAVIPQLSAQIVSIQSRYVPDQNIPEFIERETTYWSEIARKAVIERRMAKWELWQIVAGMDIDDGANFFFINEYRKPSDVDRTAEIWDHTKVFPDLEYSEIETQSLCKLVDQVFLYAQVSLVKTRPNFLRVNYARASDLGRYLELENTVWRDFVEERMNASQTNVVSWDLMRVMSPGGVDRRYNALTIDGFDKLSDALQPEYGDNPAYPDMDQFQAVHEKGKIRIYRLVKRVTLPGM